MALAVNLRTFLMADAAIAGLVANRIYPVQLPQGATVPAISYVIVGGTRHHAATQAQGLARLRVQIDCWAATVQAALDVSEAVRVRLDGYRGAAGAINIRGAFLELDHEFFEPEPRLKRVSRDYMIWCTE